MAKQTELACVSCESAFDPEPNGGFCPDCDTPHPDYDRPNGEETTEDEAIDSPDDERKTQNEDIENREGEQEAEDEAIESPEEAQIAEDDEEAERPESEAGNVDEEAESDEVTPAGDGESETPVGESDSETADDESESDTPVGESESRTPVGDEKSETPVGEDDSEPVESSADADADAVEIDDAETDDVETKESEIDEVEASEIGEAEDPETDETECSSCGSAVAPSASFCPNCGAEPGAAAEIEGAESTGLGECPDCGTDVTDESFCPNCGTDLDAVREVDVDDELPGKVTLVVADETYTLEDGETFGRQNERWLSDLVTASGGRDEASYISGEHLRFEVEDDGVYVTDLGRNGTSLDGEKLDGASVKLEGGERLTLAERAEIDVEL